MSSVLPEGFTLDAPQEDNNMGLPEGFTLDPPQQELPSGFKLDTPRKREIFAELSIREFNRQQEAQDRARHAQYSADTEDPIKELAQSMGPVDATFTGMGEGLTTIGRGIKLLEPASETEKAGMEALKEERPYTTGAGQIIGESLPFAPLGGVPGRVAGKIAGPIIRAGARTLMGGALGATEGAVIGAGRPDEISAEKGAMIGGAIGATIEGALPPLAKMTMPYMKKIGRQIFKSSTGIDAPLTMKLFKEGGEVTDEFAKILKDEGIDISEVSREAQALLKKEGLKQDPTQLLRKQIIEEGTDAPALTAQVRQDPELFQRQGASTSKRVADAEGAQQQGLGRRFDDTITETGGAPTGPSVPVLDDVMRQVEEGDKFVDTMYETAKSGASEEKVVDMTKYIKKINILMPEDELSGGMISGAKNDMRKRGLLKKGKKIDVSGDDLPIATEPISTNNKVINDIKAKELELDDLSNEILSSNINTDMADGILKEYKGKGFYKGKISLHKRDGIDKISYGTELKESGLSPHFFNKNPDGSAIDQLAEKAGVTPSELITKIVDAQDTSRTGRLFAKESKKELKKLETELQDLYKKGDINKKSGMASKTPKETKKLTIDDARNVRQRLSELYDPQNPNGNRRIAELKASLDDVVTESRGGDVYKEARESKRLVEKKKEYVNKSRRNKRKTNIIKDIESSAKATHPDWFVDNAVFKKSYDHTDLQELKRYTGGGKSWEDFRASALDQLKEKSFKGEKFSLKDFQKNLALIGDKRQKVLFTPDERRFFKQIEKVGKMIDPPKGKTYSTPVKARAIAGLSSKGKSLHIFGTDLGKLFSFDLEGRMLTKGMPEKIKSAATTPKTSMAAPISVATGLETSKEGKDNE